MLRLPPLTARFVQVPVAVPLLPIYTTGIAAATMPRVIKMAAAVPSFSCSSPDLRVLATSWLVHPPPRASGRRQTYQDGLVSQYELGVMAVCKARGVASAGGGLAAAGSCWGGCGGAGPHAAPRRRLPLRTTRAPPMPTPGLPHARRARVRAPAFARPPCRSCTTTSGRRGSQRAGGRTSAGCTHWSTSTSSSSSRSR